MSLEYHINVTIFFVSLKVPSGVHRHRNNKQFYSVYCIYMYCTHTLLRSTVVPTYVSSTVCISTTFNIRKEDLVQFIWKNKSPNLIDTNRTKTF